jgi:hypothetical protein
MPQISSQAHKAPHTTAQLNPGLTAYAGLRTHHMAKMARQKPDRRKSTLAADRPSTADDRSGVTADAIARRAFEFYCARGGGHGQDVEDWLQAELELKHGATL